VKASQIRFAEGEPEKNDKGRESVTQPVDWFGGAGGGGFIYFEYPWDGGTGTPGGGYIGVAAFQPKQLLPF
jgi:hypothetical protein